MEIPYFLSQFLPDAFAVYTSSGELKNVQENAPSDQEIMETLGINILSTLFGVKMPAFDANIGVSPVQLARNVVIGASSLGKVQSFLKSQGMIVKDGLSDTAEQFKDWFVDFSSDVASTFTNHVRKADASAQAIPILFDAGQKGAMKGIARLLADNDITMNTAISGQSHGGSFSWNTAQECKEVCNAILRGSGMITLPTECYNQNFPSTVTRDYCRMNIFEIYNKVNGKSIPAMSYVYGTLNGVAVPVDFDGFALLLNEQSDIMTFSVNGALNSASLGASGGIGMFYRSGSTYGSRDTDPYIVAPYNVQTWTEGASTYTVQLFDRLSGSTHNFNNSDEVVWAGTLGVASGFFAGMDALQRVDPANYSLRVKARNNVRYDQDEYFPAYVDPALLGKLILDEYDVLTDNNSADAIDRAKEGALDVLYPASLRELARARDLADALPRWGNAFPFDLEDLLTLTGVPLTAIEALRALADADTANGTRVTVPDKHLSSNTGAYGLFTLYKMTPSQLSALSNVLWSSNFIDNFHPFHNDPSEALISLIAYPFSIDASDTTSRIICGNYDCSPASGKVVNELFQSKSLGSVKIPQKYNNFLDYTPYTKISAVLPFIGIVKLDPDEVIGATLYLDYKVELITGTCVATIRVVKGEVNAVLYQYTGNVGMMLPLSASEYGRIFTGLVTSIGGAVAGGLMGNPAMIMGGIGGAVATMASAKPDINKAGGMSGNSGMCGNLSAYIIIDNAIPDTPSNYQTVKGKPSNKYTALSSLRGFVKLNEFNLNVSDITDSEKNELDGLLRSGIII